MSIFIGNVKAKFPGIKKIYLGTILVYSSSVNITFPATTYGYWSNGNVLVAEPGDYMSRSGNTWTCKIGGSSGTTRWTNTLTANTSTYQYTYSVTAAGSDFSVTTDATAGSATSSYADRYYTVTYRRVYSGSVLTSTTASVIHDTLVQASDKYSTTYTTAQYYYTDGSSGSAIVMSNTTVDMTYATRTLRSYTITMPTVTNGYGSWSVASGTAYYGDYMYRSGNTWYCQAGGSGGTTRWSSTLTAQAQTAQYTYSATASGSSFTVTGTATAGTATSSRSLRYYYVAFSAASFGSWSTSTINSVAYGTTISRSGNTVTVNGYGSSTYTPSASTEQYVYTTSYSVPSSVTGNTYVSATDTRSNRNYYIYWNRTSGSASACLPSGYTGLEYIQSTGTQYIDTGVNVNLNTYSFEVDSQSTDTSQNGMVFGEWLNTSTYYWWLYYYNNGGAITLYATNSSGGQQAISTGLSSSNTNRNVFKWTGKKMYVNGSLTADFSTTTFSSSQTTARICDTNVGSGVSSWPFKGKVYGCKIWNANGELVRNFIPAKNSSSVVGMYDTVNGSFYQNAGSGTFTAGPTITYGGYELDTGVTYTTALTYNSSTPTKSLGDYVYTFSGWESGNGQTVTSGSTTLSGINYGSTASNPVNRFMYPKFTATLNQFQRTDSQSVSSMARREKRTITFIAPGTVLSIDSVSTDPSGPSVYSQTFSGSTITIVLYAVASAYIAGTAYCTYTYKRTS